MINTFKTKHIKPFSYTTGTTVFHFSTKEWSNYSNNIGINDDLHLYATPNIKLIKPLKKIKSITLHNIDPYIIAIKGNEKQFFSEPLLLEWIWRLEEFGVSKKELRIQKPKKYKTDEISNSKKKNLKETRKFLYEPTLDEGQIIGWKVIIKTHEMGFFFDYLTYNVLPSKKKQFKIQYIVLSLTETAVLFDFSFPVRDSKGFINDQDYGNVRVSIIVGFGSIEETKLYLAKFGLLFDSF